MVFLRGWSWEDFKKPVGEDRPFWLLNSMIQTPGSISSFPLPISTAQVRHHNCSPKSRSMLHRLPSGQWRRESRTQARLECEAAQGISSMDESVTPVLTLQRSEQRRCFQSATSTSNLSTPSKASQLCLLLSRSLLQTFWRWRSPHWSQYIWPRVQEKSFSWMPENCPLVAEDVRMPGSSRLWCLRRKTTNWELQMRRQAQ